MHALTLLALLPAVLGAPTAGPAPAPEAAPVIVPRGVNLIPNKYIVKLKEGATSELVDAIVGKLGAITPHYVYKANGFKGFASKLDDKLLEIISRVPEVSLAPIRWILNTTLISRLGRVYRARADVHHQLIRQPVRRSLGNFSSLAQGQGQHHLRVR